MLQLDKNGQVFMAERSGDRATEKPMPTLVYSFSA